MGNKSVRGLGGYKVGRMYRVAVTGVGKEDEKPWTTISLDNLFTGSVVTGNKVFQAILFSIVFS